MKKIKDFEDIAAGYEIEREPRPKKPKSGPLGALVFIFLIFIIVYAFSCCSGSDNKQAEPKDTKLETVYYLKERSERIVKEALKAPSTAEFPSISEWEFRGDLEDKVYAISYVDAQNSFGAMIREKFTIEFEYQDGKYEPICFSLGDEFVFDYRESGGK